MLEFLCGTSGEVVTRSMLADHVWGERYGLAVEPDRGVHHRLRKKIERADAPRLLHTVRGAGYSCAGARAG